MATYQYNILLIPESEALHTMCFPLEEDLEFWDHDWWNKSLPFKVIEPILKQHLPEIEWSKKYSDLHQFGDDETNDISISLVDDTFIENIHVRIDLREIDHLFIELVMNIAEENDCLLLDRQGVIFNPSIEKLRESIQRSNASKFVSDPTGFLSRISSGEITPE